ncbi:MAG: ATP-binding cassette domain-containing protein [Gammaproteobacteria bacterium]|nr:ATP-binding cassette domain-containing protein [Gammaproteobacteria bacterium]
MNTSATPPSKNEQKRQAVIEIEGLSAGYGPMRVIHDLDLSVYPGERVGLVGLNGHGKSTLFFAIAGLTTWQRGSILLNGRQVGRTRSQGPGRYTHTIVQQGLALIPQGDEIFTGLSVEDHLDSGAFTKQAWRERSKRKARVLEIFPPLGKLMKTPVGRLSGGERRMVSIGRGLMSDASLFLVDEPSLGLAPKIGKSVLDALMSLDLRDAAMVIAEQNFALLDGKVDRTLNMHAGKLKGGTGLSFGVHAELEKE